MTLASADRRICRTEADKTTQQAILDEVRRISYHVDPKVRLGLKWLCTYIAIRPGELSSIREKHIDLENGYLFVPHPKEKKPKLVPLLEEDIEFIRALNSGFPESPFFIHPIGIKGCPPGSQYGYRYFYKWWKRACNNIGVENIDLYGGTRHSPAMALRKDRTPGEIKRGTMHSTNKAFERYFERRARTSGRSTGTPLPRQEQMRNFCGISVNKRSATAGNVLAMDFGLASNHKYLKKKIKLLRRGESNPPSS